MSGGNPFFALELARALDQRGGPIESDEPLPVPGELRALLNDRLDALPEPTQAALIVASALSQPTIPLLRAALGPDVEKALVPAFEAHIAEREGERIAFAHPLHSFATYSRVSPKERRELHTRLAALVSDPEERARHLAIAVERPDEAVALALERGARSASSRGATHSAAELCARARHLTPAERLDNIRRRGMAEAEYRILATDSAGARDVLEEIIPLARPGLERAELLRRLADAYLYGVDWRASADTYRQALAEAGANDTLRANCEMGLAVTSQVLNAPVREMREHARAAAELAERAGEPSLFRAALAVDALSELLIGDENPWETIERACALEPSMEGGPIILRPSQFLAHMLGLVDDFPAALAGFEEGVRQAVESGDEVSQGWLLARMSQVACLAGTWKDALHHLAAGDEVLVQAGQPANTAFLLSSRALVEAHFGRASSARRAGEAALEIAQKTNAAIARKIALWALGHLALSLGQPTEAHASLEPIVAETRAAGIREPGEMRFFPDEIEALVMLGEIEAAVSTLSFFQECATSSGRTSALAAAARCQGLIAAAKGDVQRGLEALRASALAYEEVQLPFERARTLLILGSVSLRARQKRVAREALEDAAAGFERLGAEVWAGRARAEFARIGGRPRSDGSLTPTEWRVAELVAQGRTNREVAAALFVTVRTVEGHLSRIYAEAVGPLPERARSALRRPSSDSARSLIPTTQSQVVPTFPNRPHGPTVGDG